MPSQIPAQMPLNPACYYKMRDDLLKIPDAAQAIMDAANNLPVPPITLATTPGAFENIAAFRFVEKPLYSWMGAKLGGLGDRYSFMWRNHIFPSHTVMAGLTWDIQMPGYTPIGGGVRAFRDPNAVAPSVVGGPMPMPGYPNMVRPQVALRRLYYMRRIATNLPRALNAIRDAQNGFIRSNTSDEFLVWASPIKNNLNIGITTVFHATSDMGYECIKPDNHVTRTLAHFELLEYRNGTGGAVVNANAFLNPKGYLNSDWRKCLVVSKAVALARSLDPNQLLFAFRENPCREVDIVLMQASLHDVILKY